MRVSPHVAVSLIYHVTIYVYFLWDFPASRGLTCSLYTAILAGYMLSAAAVYNGVMVCTIFSGSPSNIIGHAESAMPWVYCYLPIMLN